jgi:hypothetical protein
MMKMSLLELRKKSLILLLMSFMALGMVACSSTGDSDDSGSGEAPTKAQCDLSPSLDGCEEYLPDGVGT